MSAEEEEAGVHAANARALQEECQAELNQAMPALHGESLAVLLRVWTRRCTYSVRGVYVDVCCVYRDWRTSVFKEVCGIFVSIEVNHINSKKNAHSIDKHFIPPGPQTQYK